MKADDAAAVSPFEEAGMKTVVAHQAPSRRRPRKGIPLTRIPANEDVIDSAGGYAALTLIGATSEVLTVEYKLNLVAAGQQTLIRVDA